MNAAPNPESFELFLQEASDHLQHLREYSGIVQEPQATPDDFERLYIAAHTLCGTSASYGFPLFSEISGKLAHIFQYAMNAALGPDTIDPLAEFLTDAISVLEFDLLQIASGAPETLGEIAAFKQRYSFAFPPTVEDIAAQDAADSSATNSAAAQQFVAPPAFAPGAEFSLVDRLPLDAGVPAEVLEFFVPEAEDHLHTATQCLLALEAKPDDEQIHRLFRAIHTLKGSAAQVGLHRVSAVAHRVEDLLGRLRDGFLAPSTEIIDCCLESVDVLKKFLHHSWSSDDEMRAQTDSLLARLHDFAPAFAEEFAAVNFTNPAFELPHLRNFESIDPRETASALASPSATAAATASTAAYQKSAATDASAAKSVRLSLDRLDRMMNSVGELVVNRTRMVGRLAELGKLLDVLNFSKSRLTSKVSEFQDKHEFNRIHSTRFQRRAPRPERFFGFENLPGLGDPNVNFSDLEMDRYDDFNILSRSLAEISADVTEVLTQLGNFMNRVDTDIDEFTKLAHNLQDEITRARMVPIGTLYTRLSRTVRDAAKASAKSVELILEGSDTELDNNIIQQISDPLIHLVRNAVAHGIEEPHARRQAAKSEQGRITVRAYHRGNHIFIEIEDDGAGIDYEKIRARALESGRITYAQAGQIAESSLREFLFEPGFSTAAEKSELAGRGVGLDVVRSNVHALNGEIELRSELNKGSVFTLKVPLTLIISQALFVRAGEYTFALPLALIEEIRRVRPDEIEEVGGKLLTKVRGAITEVVRIDSRLGLPSFDPINGHYRMVIVKVAGHSTGILVEDVLGKDEIVIKNLGEYLRRVKLFPGTTIAADGSLILLIDLNRLISVAATEPRNASIDTAGAARIFAPGSGAVAAGSIPAEAVDAVPGSPLIVVVDDSISVRKFVGRMLEKAGYRVKLAADGLEATEIVAQSRCQLVITDLEMPRMNGYELMTHLRQNSTTRQIPVMVVTSRAGAKHREWAMKDGAVAFLTKPVQEDQLIETIEGLVGDRTGMLSPSKPKSLSSSTSTSTLRIPVGAHKG